MSKILLNCSECLRGAHDTCKNPDNCLCAIETNHDANIVKEEEVEEPVYAERQAKVKALLRESDFSNFRNEKRNKEDKIDEVVDHIQLYYDFITLRKSNEIYLYDGKIYNLDKAVSLIKELSEQLIVNCTEHDRNEVLAKIKAQTYKDGNFDSDPNILTLESGILNLDTLESTEHNPGNQSRVLLPVEYHKPEYEIREATIFEDIEKNLSETLFYNSLRECFTVEGKFRKKDFESVLEMMASVFIKRQIDDTAWINHGVGNNGKSVFLEYIQSILGMNNVSNIALHALSDDRFLSAELDGKMANIYADLESNELKKTSILKQIASGEGLTVQRKHQQPFKMIPFAKLIFSCNRFPIVFEQTEGFFRRWIIITWERDFEKDSIRNENLRQELCNNQEEKNHVFSCLIALSNKINKCGKLSHIEDWRTIQKDWNKNADPVDDFACNYIIDSVDFKSRRETFDFYKEWCYEHGERPLKFKQFNDRFAEYYEEDRQRVDNKTTRVWLYIDFKRPKQETLVDKTY